MVRGLGVTWFGVWVTLALHAFAPPAHTLQKLTTSPPRPPPPAPAYRSQGHLFNALRKTRLIPEHADVGSLRYSRCGRTDKGVSALGQVCVLACVVGVGGKQGVQGRGPGVCVVGRWGWRGGPWTSCALGWCVCGGGRVGEGGKGPRGSVPWAWCALRGVIAWPCNSMHQRICLMEMCSHSR